MTDEISTEAPAMNATEQTSPAAPTKSDATEPASVVGPSSKPVVSPKTTPERQQSRGGGASRTGKVAVEEIAAGISTAGRQMSPKLRELLMGTVVLRVLDRSRAFLFDPKGEGFPMQESSGPAAKTIKGDCVIDLTEMSLQRMWNGELNPQIAMLSDKVTISGKSELAVYFFNLISPK